MPPMMGREGVDGLRCTGEMQPSSGEYSPNSSTVRATAGCPDVVLAAGCSVAVPLLASPVAASNAGIQVSCSSISRPADRGHVVEHRGQSGAASA